MFGQICLPYHRGTPRFSASSMVKAMGAMGAIVAFTKTNAAILGIESETGTIEPGKLADILVVRGNPLTNMERFKDHRENLFVVMQGGRFHKNLLPS